MQPPPRTVPSGATGPPLSAAGHPNAFRRTRPDRPGNSTMMLGLAQPVPVMTDPFAFGRQVPSTMSTGNHAQSQKSSPHPMQTPPPVGFPQTAPVQGQSTPPYPQEGAQGPHPVSSSFSLSSHTPEMSFAPNSAVSQAHQSGHSFTSTNLAGMEQNHLNSVEHLPYIMQGAPPYGSAPVQSQLSYGQEFKGDPISYAPLVPSAMPLQAQTMQPTASHWMTDNGSRPPSVQNYFQPTSDHPSQPFNVSPLAPPVTLSPHAQQTAPSPDTPRSSPSPYAAPHNLHPNPSHPAKLGPSGSHSTAPVPDPAWHQEPMRNTEVNQHQNFPIQAQSYLSQNYADSDPSFSQPSQEHFYHQMGGDPGSSRSDSTNSATNSGQAGPGPYITDPGTIAMFFKGNDVENEEILAGDGKVVNGVPGGNTSVTTHGRFLNPVLPNHQGPPSQLLPGTETAQGGCLNLVGDRNAQPTGEVAALYMNDSGFDSGTPKQGGQFDHVENLECVPNLEVLPSEPQKMPSKPQNISDNMLPGLANTAIQVGAHYEGGPNLETPDSVPRPVRPESVSSSYSNVSHGSASSSRRHQGVVGTFIQQEIAKPSEESSAGYFEQVDTSPAGESAQQNTSSRMYHSQLSQQLTPSPPKPTGIFQASANSSFEPVRSQIVGVRPFEVDQARMVMEKSSSGPPRMAVSDVSPGNLEQPPDNLENIFMPSAQHPEGLPSLQERRPSSRAHGPRLMCESPATTLWAQNENPILGANILLAPAAPPVHGPVKPPSAEVIQPPEDGPLNLQAPQNALLPLQKPESSSENLENPPKVGDGDPKNPQASLNYASLLVTSPSAESFQNQPVLIAPPATSCNVIPPNNSVSMANQIISNENAGADVGSLLMPQSSETSGAHAMPIATSKTANNLPHLISSQVIPPGDLSNRSSLNPTPLNLAPISRQIQKPENTPVASTSRPPNPLVSGADSLGGLTHSTTSFNSQAAPANDHKQSTNYELLDFTMHHSQNNHNEAPDLGSYVPSGVSQQVPTLALGAKSCVPVSNTTGFYLQVTKDTQQGGRGGRERQAQALADPAAYIQQPAPDSSRVPETQPNLHGQGDASSNQPSPALPQNNQYPHPLPPGPGAPVLPGTLFSGPGDSQPPPYSQQAGNSSQPPPPDPQRPPSVLGVQPGYMVAPPVPGPGYGNYYGAPYSEYLDGRPPYPPQYPPSDPRFQQYYQDDPHRRYDPRYPGYEGPNSSYRDTERYQPREQPERPSSRASQYSDRPSSRQGYPASYQGPVRSAYDAYYADYYKKPQEFGDRSRWEHYDPAAAYDPRYRGYYDQSYWYKYEPEAYRQREAYFNQPYPNRREGYDDQWRYDPRYDSSFDDDYRRQRDPYGDECDRHSVHSEQSAHSLPSSHSHHSRRSSFSAHSQQSQVYRSQQDLVAAGYEPPSQPTSLPVDYSYGQYPDNVDGSQAYVGYQYPTGYPTDSGWPATEERPPKPSTPEKYAVPHRCARFGPGGQMIQVLPNLPSAGQPALVEIHSMEIMLQNSQEQEDFRSFPGPLVKEETHKVDVIKFAQNKSLECMRNDSLIDKDSALLIWEFIVLLCRQNGTVVGTDIADLLLKEHKSVWLPGKSPNEANLIDFNNEPLERADDEPGSGLLSLLSDTFMIVPENAGKETERFRELLLFGRKKDALESAMKNGLWGHALLLASKMDNRTHARVMTRFANSLPINDPLQTVYQLMSGRMPAAATCCGDEKWGDWRPHLAMVLSNLTQTLDLDTRTIATMGDTLASKGLIDAAHFCYMMAQVGLGVYTKKSTKMVLIGANHSLPFLKFASNEAIQRTEAYEYAQSLGSQPCSLPNFQVFKFIYACRLAEAGLCAQAFHYCEVTSRAVLSYPTYHSPSFISQLAQMSAKLRFFDPQLKERPEQELFIEPDWLVHLKHLERQIKDGTFSYSTDRVTPQQYACSTPSSEFDQSSPPDPTGLPSDMAAGPENPLMSSLLPNPGPTPQGVQLMPPAPPTILDEGVASMPQSPPTADGVKFYPVPPAQVVPTLGPVPSTQGPTPGAFPTMPGYGSIYQPEQPEMYSGPPTHPQVPSQLPPGEPLPTPLEQQGSSQPSSPTRPGLNTQMDFYDQMAHMGPGRRSRTTSQSSMLMSPGRRSRTTSESSSHSTGRERSNSAKQSSPPPPPIPEQPNRQEEPAKPKKDSPKKGGGGSGGGGGWLNWLYRKGKNEAHLPDDKNKSIVWDEKKQRWVNMDEPEEESKPPPPPPSCFPKMGPQMGPGGPGGPPSGGPQVNMFSRKAGTRSRYVDVLNPGGTSAKPGVSAPAPADLFAPLAPMAMPANLFVPGADEQQPMEGSTAEMGGSPGQSTAPQVSNPTLYPPAQEGAPIMEGTRSEELSRSSSMSSLSREVSQHLNQVPSQPPVQGAPAPGGVIFYNPTQFAQPNAPSAGRGRIGQRKYPTLK